MSICDDEDDKGKSDEPAKKKRKHLDVVRWTTAHMNLEIAADAVGVNTMFTIHGMCVWVCMHACPFHEVWKFHASQAHLKVCLKIAATAATEKRRSFLAMLYDEIARKEWAEKATRGTANVFTCCAACVCARGLCQATLGSMSMSPASAATKSSWTARAMRMMRRLQPKKNLPRL